MIDIYELFNNELFLKVRERKEALNNGVVFLSYDDGVYGARDDKGVILIKGEEIIEGFLC